MNEYWFGVNYTFACSICRKVIEEKAAVRSNTTDQTKIANQLNKELLKCPYCHTVLADGTGVAVEVTPGTLESLKSAGFPFPPGI